ncbi:hypothetical protein [Bacillus thermotolerans]|uniref:Uncharacterized protein n=1 Tax=Bacillus thermotolerans TaxID=1221996 RepID=A0A0F5I986_BACTR|nr:hypothetical protein [Bacillus thermotolerans]KKB41742.1 hypothetical protein QY95_00549 [Bacillus thermotolerans]KKB44366.1 hypothetical protein QY96_02966 [Bacillus thermotolerans]
MPAFSKKPDNEPYLYGQLASIFEYHIQRIKIEKVKGTFQLGHLIEQERISENSLHRFFIGEIKITEVEGTGTVGIGLTQKGSKKEEALLSPQKADKEIQSIYQDSQSLLNINQVPRFLQRLAVRKPVLKAVWNDIKRSWQTSAPFDRFYENVLALLDELPLPSSHSTRVYIPSSIRMEAADSLEEQAKTLFIALMILQYLLPGEVKVNHLKRQKVQAEKLQPSSSHPNAQNMLQAIKEGLQIKQLPSTLKQLEEHAYALHALLFSILQPLVQKGQLELYVHHLNALYAQTIKQVSFDLSLTELTAEEWSFLFTQAAEHLEEAEKHLLLNYPLALMCDREAEKS